MERRHASLLVVFLMSCGFITVSRAADVETLLMPGKVAQPHAHLESQCANCHDRSNRTRQAALCAGCHEQVREDLRTQRGFHGRLLGGERIQCRACHAEHQGRDADIVKFVAEQFDHRRADFVPAEAHAALPCNSCHESGKRFSQAPSTCVGCHRADEPHQGRLGNNCGSCHNALTWNAVRFDHDRTRFALQGRHEQLACLACHFGNRFRDTPRQCVACHAPDDPHRGARGNDCAACHEHTGWTTQKFDHERQTGFALTGRHATAQCGECHVSGRMEDPLPKDCHGCHRAEDSHAGRFGKRCETCHGTERWNEAHFDHARDTRFELLGAHAKVECHACHTANVTRTSGAASGAQSAQTCAGCHRGRDVHAGRLGTECEQCHSPAGWRTEVRFDHDLVDFPLLGQHVAVGCEQCHLTPAFKDTRSDCYSCHRSEDRHRGSLGEQCDNCHSPNGWNLWEFDHARTTGFALQGAHAKLGCSTCHRGPPGEAQLARECVACHTKDDVHFGEFGRQCQRCHSTQSFKQVRIR